MNPSRREAIRRLLGGIALSFFSRSSFGAGEADLGAVRSSVATELLSSDFPTVQHAVDAAISSGRTLIVAPGPVGRLVISGRVTIAFKGTTACAHDGVGAPWIAVTKCADHSILEFEDIDFAGHGTIGVLLNASHCRVIMKAARNMVGQPYGVANRQGAVVSQGADNFIDVTAFDFRLGTSDNGSVPRVVTTDGGSVRNIVRIKANRANCVWVENGEDNSAEYIIADAVTDNGIYNLSGSVRMRCEYLRYTNSKEEAFVLEGKAAYIRKAIYDGWSYPGVQNCTGAVVDEIVLLPPPDAGEGGVSTCALRSRDGNVQADITMRKISGDLYVGGKPNIGAFLHFYVGQVDYAIGELDLKIHYLAKSRAADLVVHRHGHRIDLGSVRITFDDSVAQPGQPLVWKFPPGANFNARDWRPEKKPYAYLTVQEGR